MAGPSGFPLCNAKHTLHCHDSYTFGSPRSWVLISGTPNLTFCVKGRLPIVGWLKLGRIGRVLWCCAYGWAPRVWVLWFFTGSKRRLGGRSGGSAVVRIGSAARGG